MVKFERVRRWSRFGGGEEGGSTFLPQVLAAGCMVSG